MSDASTQWKSIGFALVILLAFGMISDKTERIAIGVAVVIAVTMFLKRMGEKP